MKTLKEVFIDEGIDPELAKRVLEIVSQHQVKVNRTICSICYVDLTEDEKMMADPGHYNLTCNDHAEWRDVYQRDEIRNNLGIAKKNFFDL